MRRGTTSGLLVLALVTSGLAAGCGGGSGSGGKGGALAAVLRSSAGSTAATGSSKVVLTSSTQAQGQTVTFEGDGAFDYTTKQGLLDLHVGGLGSGAGSATIAERITGGFLYLKLPNSPNRFYKLKVTDLAGTSLAAGSDPTSSLSALVGASDDVTKVGQEVLRGTTTTHYQGTIDVQKALGALTGTRKDLVQKGLVANGVKRLPFDAYVDDQGRVRKYVQRVHLTLKGAPADSTTTIELYDFGTKVEVAVPPASQVKDGTALLGALKRKG